MSEPQDLDKWIQELETQVSTLQQQLAEKDLLIFESFKDHVHFSSFEKLKLLTDEKINNLNTIIKHGVSISSLHSLPDLLYAMLDSAMEMLKLDKVCVFFPRREKKSTVLRIIASRGISIETLNRFRLRPGEGIAGWSYTSGLEDLVYDASNDERFLVRKGHRSRRETIMVVPMRHDKKAIGVLCAEKALSRERLFTRNELDYLIILANFTAAAIKNTQLYQKLQNRLQETFTLMEISEAITSTLNLDRVLDLILKNISRIIGVQRCSIMLLNRDRTHLSIRATLGFPSHDRRTIISIGEGIAGRVAATGEPLLIQDIDTHPQFKRTKSEEYISQSLLCVPLRYKGSVIGVLNITNKRNERAFTEVDQKLVLYYADQVSIAIENANLYAQVEKMATTDSLTGLANHRFFQDVLAESFSHAKTKDLPLALIMIDVDNFKRLNDTYGHLAGDEVLRTIGSIILEAEAPVDVFPSRYGGEEFAIIMPGWSEKDSLEFAEQLRLTVMVREIRTKINMLSVTMCCGIAAINKDMATPQDLIARADAALYQAKRSGKNKTILADHEPA